MPHSQHRDSTTSTAPSDEYTTATTPSSLDGFSQPSSFTLNVASTMKVVPLSPAVGGFSFDTGSEPSSPTNVHSSEHHQPVRDPNDIMRHVDRDAPGSPRNFDGNRKSSRTTDSRRMTKLSYFEESFGYRHDWETNMHEKVIKDSPVLAELRTNVIIKDEYSLVTDLSAHIASRFQRTEATVMINVTHSACLMYGGSFEPAYILTVTALDSQCQAATNKRNTALMQSFLADVLSVTPDRGVIRFQPIKDECLGTNGRTIAGLFEKIQGDNGSAVKHGGRKSTMGEAIRRKSLFSGDRRKSSAPDKDDRKPTATVGKDVGGHKESVKSSATSFPPNASISTRSSTSSAPSVPTYLDTSALAVGSKTLKAASTSHLNTTDELLAEASRVLSQMSLNEQANAKKTPLAPPSLKSQSRPSSRKSKVEFSSSTPLKPFPNAPPPPPVPIEAERPSTKVSRRKSFIALFKRDTAKAG